LTHYTAANHILCTISTTISTVLIYLHKTFPHVLCSSIQQCYNYGPTKSSSSISDKPHVASNT